jgi:hypothetical protein
VTKRPGTQSVASDQRQLPVEFFSLSVFQLSVISVSWQGQCQLAGPSTIDDPLQQSPGTDISLLAPGNWQLALTLPLFNSRSTCYRCSKGEAVVGQCSCRGRFGLASVHKCLRIRDLCKELAFGNQCGNAYSGDLYNYLDVNVLCRQFLERAVLARSERFRLSERGPAG